MSAARRIGKHEVGGIGIGTIGLSEWYGTVERSNAREAVARAVDFGINLIDTADIYGPFTSEEIVGEAIHGQRDRVVLASKGGFVMDERSSYTMHIDGRPEHLRSAIEASLRRLQTDHLDLYYLHRADPDVPLTESIGELAAQVEKGTIREIGVSNLTLEQLEEAKSVHSPAAVQVELSVWAQESLREILPWSVENWVTFVAYAPLGRGFLAGVVPESSSLGEGDMRRRMPQFSGADYEANRSYVSLLEDIGRQHEATAAQVALAWVLSHGDHVVCIPGMDQIEQLRENVGALDMTLTTDDLSRLADVYGRRDEA